MKINDKFLMAYARSPKGFVQREGYLNKKGELNRGYQRRWFVLKGNLLFYFEKQNDRNPIGVIILEDCNVDVCDADRYSFTLSFSGDRTRTYVLCADSEEDMISWMKRITVAPYSYTEMVVNELEKRLARLKSEATEATCEPSDGLIGAVANVDTKEDEWTETDRGIIPTEKRNLDKSIKIKGSSDRNTIAGHPKSFNNLLTVVSAASSLKNNLIPSIRRSKSSENLNRIINKSPAVSPVAPRRKVYQSVMRRKAQNVKVIETGESRTTLKEVAKPQKKETFILLHNRYAASIWTTIKEYENESLQDLMKL